MSEQDKNLALLPAGFADLLPPEAQREADAITILMQEFTCFGYSRVKPPLAEFEDSLLGRGPGSALADQTFRLMDPASHRMMGIRPDITIQIARIAASRLASAPRPLRLTYAGDVLRMQSSQQRTERQFCQVGCEIIGSADSQADIEICVLALSGLAALRIRPLTLDLTMPRLVTLLMDEHKIPADKRAGIKDALARRDIESVEKLAGGAAAVLVKLIKDSGPAKKALTTLGDLKLSGQAKDDFEKLKAVHAGVIAAIEQLGLENVSVTIDPVEHKGFDYESGIGFTLFAAGARGELGRGGRYDIAFGNSAETATGFTLYMDEVCRVMTLAAAGNIVFVSSAESWETIRALQGEGWIVLRGMTEKDAPSSCTHEYKGGKIQELKK